MRSDVTEPKRGLTNEQLIEIGRVAVGAGGLDMVLTLLAGALSSDANAAHVLIAGDSVDTKVTKLTNLAAEKLAGSSLQERVLGWLSTVRAVHQRRDFLLHSAWLLGADDATKETVTAYRIRRSGLRSEEFDVDELRQEADALREAFEEGGRLFAEFTKPVPANENTPSAGNEP